MLVTKKENKIVALALLSVFIFLIVMSIKGGYSSIYSGVFITAYFVFFSLYFTFIIIKSIRLSKSMRLTEKRCMEDTFRNTP